jgi:hypothetical protein
MKKKNYRVSNLIKVKLAHPDSFSIVVETLTRVGLPSRNNKSLIQLCYILHKRGDYFIAHTNEMFLIDGFDIDISEDDIARRNAVVQLLIDWKLVTTSDDISDQLHDLKVIKHKEKDQWNLMAQYQIGQSLQS